MAIEGIGSSIVPDVASPHCCLRHKLYPALAEATLGAPANFAKRIVQILSQYFGLRGASFYSFDPKRKILILRGQHGLDYSLYQSFELDLQTFAGRAITSGAFQVFNNLNSRFFRDKDLIDRFHLRRMLVVPLREPPEGTQDRQPIGVLCIYPTNRAAIDQIREYLEELSPLIARLYVASLEHLKLALRKAIVEKAGHSKDIGSFLHRAVKVIQANFSVEAASIFLLDPRNNLLRLRATTADLKEQIFYSVNSPDSTNDAFRCNTRLVLSASSIRRDSTTGWEPTKSPLHTCLLLPLSQAPTEPDQTIGLIRLLNWNLTHDGISHLTTFGREELALLDYVSELIAVAVHLMHRGVHAEYDFTRRMHGAKNALQSTLFNLINLKRHGGVSDLPQALQYCLTDSISFLSDLKSQIQRLEWGQRQLPTEPVKLYGEVLSKLTPMILEMARAIRVTPFNVSDLEDAGFRSIPAVMGNREALLAVFRNVVENAVKYYSPKRLNSIEFSYEDLGDRVRVLIADHGVGIDATIKDHIFLEGYRAPYAMARWPAGTGFGLADCKDLMRKMRGDISHIPHNDKTVFAVDIPKALRG